MNVDSRIVDLAHRLGCPLMERDALDTWIFDGNNLATLRRQYKRRHYDDESYDLVPMENERLLHELGHWYAADECQRTLPEFGLMIGIALPAYGPLGGEFRDFNGNIRDVPNNVLDGLVDGNEQLVQENVAQLLEVRWGTLLGIAPGWNFASWREYEIFKDDEAGGKLEWAIARHRAREKLNLDRSWVLHD